MSGEITLALGADGGTLFLEDAGWVIDGPRGAARALGLHPSTLRNRMRKLGIRRPD